MSERPITFAWWNVENLFPPNQHPNWEEWDEALFDEKLAHLGEAIRAMGPDNLGPDLLGLCEVADERVLEGRAHANRGLYHGRVPGENIYGDPVRRPLLEAVATLRGLYQVSRRV